MTRAMSLKTGTALFLFVCLAFILLAYRTEINYRNGVRQDRASCEQANAFARNHNHLIGVIEVGVKANGASSAVNAAKLARYDDARVALRKC